LTPFQY